jgi:molybdate/tungstate transport system permease protein
LGALLVAYIALPLAVLFVRLPWDHVSPILGGPFVADAIKTSLETTSISTFLLVIGGVPLAYVLATRRFYGRGLVTAIVYLPLVLPPVVGGVLLLLVWGSTGTIGHFFSPHNVYFVNEMIGIVLCQIFVSAPFVIVTSRQAFEAVDGDLMESARTMGAGTARVFRSIALPLSARAILAGAVLAWMRSFGEFGATAIVAFHPTSFPVEVYDEISSAPFFDVLPLALLAVVVGLLVLAVAAVIERVGLEARRIAVWRTPARTRE